MGYDWNHREMLPRGLRLPFRPFSHGDYEYYDQADFNKSNCSLDPNDAIFSEQPIPPTIFRFRPIMSAKMYSLTCKLSSGKSARPRPLQESQHTLRSLGQYPRFLGRILGHRLRRLCVVCDGLIFGLSEAIVFHQECLFGRYISI